MEDENSRRVVYEKSQRPPPPFLSRTLKIYCGQTRRREGQSVMIIEQSCFRRCLLLDRRQVFLGEMIPCSFF